MKERANEQTNVRVNKRTINEYKRENDRTVLYCE